jgi:hypothetical protein
MTRVSNLTADNPELSEIKALESQREQVKVTITLSPEVEFIMDNLQRALSSRTRTAAVASLLEAAALDWLEAKGYTTDSKEFRTRYLRWLNEDHLGEVSKGDPDIPDGARELFWDRVAL